MDYVIPYLGNHTTTNWNVKNYFIYQKDGNGHCADIIFYKNVKSN